VLVLDPRGRLLDLNPAARQVLADTGGLLGRPLAALLPLPGHLTTPETVSATVTLTVGGGERAFDFTRTPLIVRGAMQGAVVSLRDVTDRERAMAQIAHLAHHDALTGLLNRATFIARLDAALAAQQGEGSALFFLDLDGFKAVNDTYGHAAGDRLLVEAAGRLRSCVPADGLLARLGGDEFTVCLATTEPAAIAAVVRDLQHVFAQPFLLGEQRISLAVSIGSAVAPDDGRAASALLHAADLAMYTAKGLGRAEQATIDARWMHGAVPLSRPMARGCAASSPVDGRTTGPDARAFVAHPYGSADEQPSPAQDD
jgi:diguanylate cyclase (GGDEF)-like protein